MSTVKEKYGFVPTSVLHFGKTKNLTRGFLGNQEWRKENTDNSSSSSMSEFNPDLCKFIIEYWSNTNDLIIDPYHGWGTRAVMSKQLKRNYKGFDISKETNTDVKKMLDTNREQAKWFSNETVNIQVIHGDGVKLEGIESDSADLVFSCPPYFNIEKYESCEGQLSDINNYSLFMDLMLKAAKRQLEVLKENKYVVMVVGDWRVDGELLMFSKDMVDTYIKAGFIVHDFVIHKLNSAAIVGCGNFDDKNFVTKSHEYVLVFKKVTDKKSINTMSNVTKEQTTLKDDFSSLRKEFPGIPDSSLKKIMEQREE